jgi:hypothetical protein
VNEILSRVEAQYAFVDPHKVEERPFGLVATRALPEPATVRRRNGRQNGSGNGKVPDKQGDIITVPHASQPPPAEPPGPSAELDTDAPDADD